jgi:hypothetical protein
MDHEGPGSTRPVDALHEGGLGLPARARGLALRGVRAEHAAHLVTGVSAVLHRRIRLGDDLSTDEDERKCEDRSAAHDGVGPRAVTVEA